MKTIFIDRFSAGLDDLTRREQRDIRIVARRLAKLGRFSIFEATENDTIARTMNALTASGWFKFDSESVGYPWTNVSLTDAGREALADPTP